MQQVIASEDKLLLKPAQAAEQVGVKVPTIWNWCRSGKLPHIQLSKRNFRIRQSDLDSFLNSLTR